MELDIGADFFVGLGKQVEGIGHQLDRMNRCKPINNKAFGTGIVDASGDDLLIPCTTSPPAGRVWNLLSCHLLVAGQPFATVPGSSVKWGVFIGLPGGDPSSTQADLSEAIYRIGATTISNLDVDFSKQVYWVHSQETVYSWISGATAATQLAFTAWYAEYPVEAVEALSIG